MLDKILKLAKQLNQTKTAQAGVAALFPQTVAPAAAASTGATGAATTGAGNAAQGLGYLAGQAQQHVLNPAAQMYGAYLQPQQAQPLVPQGFEADNPSTWGSTFNAPAASSGQATMPTFNPQAMQNIPMPMQRALARTYHEGTGAPAPEVQEEIDRDRRRTTPWRRGSQSSGDGGNQGNDNQGGSRWGRAARWGLGVPFALQAVSGLLGSGGGEGGMAGMLQNVNQQYQNRRNMLETMNQYYMNPLFKHFGERPEVSEELRNAPRNIMEDPVMGPIWAMQSIKVMQDQRGELEDMLNDAAERGILSEEEVANRMRGYDQQINALADQFNLRSPDRPRGELNSDDLRQRARARLSRRM